LNNLCSKVTDGKLLKYINRPISKWITSKLVNYPLTPNQISILVFLPIYLARNSPQTRLLITIPVSKDVSEKQKLMMTICFTIQVIPFWN